MCCGFSHGRRPCSLWLTSRIRSSGTRLARCVWNAPRANLGRPSPSQTCLGIHIYIYIYIFLGLRPLAGYASLNTMSCFCAMIWLVRLCMLPTLTPDNAGDAGFLGPIRAPTQKADMGSRARARGPQKSSPKRAARKPSRKRE